MTPVEMLLVALAGAAGAVVRHELTAGPHAVRATAAVNVVGGGLLGVATVALATGPLLVLGGGLLGSATTFSTWMVQADGAATGRVVVVPLAAGVAAAVGGRLLASALGLGS